MRRFVMKRKKEPAKRIYLDDYILQKDMRVRMPKEIIKNMNVKPGESYFEVYFEPDKQEIVLTVKNIQGKGDEDGNL